MEPDAAITDTIAAIATPPGIGGLAVIRVSGPRALEIADRTFHGRGEPPSRRPAGTFVHGRIVSADETLDEVLLLVMRAPHSYTGEDTVEIQCHGGLIPARRILRAVLDAGARAAEPGEFTRRAFLHGKLDLAQAEAVLDLVHARSERAAAAALRQLEGSLSSSVQSIYDETAQALADVEALLDFPEEDLPEHVLATLPQRVAAVIEDIEGLARTWDEGHLLREGALVVISGPPNVGKSTLLNLLLGRERAIVSHVPGTTRDTIEETLVLEGIPLRVVDTAGLRETTCEVERAGISRARRELSSADLHLFVLDCSRPLEQHARDELAALPAARTIVVLNKQDLGCVLTPADLPSGYSAVSTSLLQGRGLEDVRRALGLVLERHVDLHQSPHAVVSERHRELLQRAGAEMRGALDLLRAEHADENLVLAAEHLRSALENTGRVIGRTWTEELLDNIFSRFCIGK